MLKRYPHSLRWRQALPPLFILAILMLLLGSLISTISLVVLGIGLGFYLLVLIAGSIPVARRKKDFSLLVGVPLAIMTMHFSWGSGFLWSILHWGSEK
jgi:energy-coupling factor transporter transmembrane protein EcfT